jgi:hypothetical protein
MKYLRNFFHAQYFWACHLAQDNFGNKFWWSLQKSPVIIDTPWGNFLYYQKWSDPKDYYYDTEQCLWIDTEEYDYEAE